MSTLAPIAAIGNAPHAATGHETADAGAAASFMAALLGQVVPPAPLTTATPLDPAAPPTAATSPADAAGGPSLTGVPARAVQARPAAAMLIAGPLVGSFAGRVQAGPGSLRADLPATGPRAAVRPAGPSKPDQAVIAAVAAKTGKPGPVDMAAASAQPDRALPVTRPRPDQVPLGPEPAPSGGAAAATVDPASRPTPSPVRRDLPVPASVAVAVAKPSPSGAAPALAPAEAADGPARDDEPAVQAGVAGLAPSRAAPAPAAPASSASSASRSQAVAKPVAATRTPAVTKSPTGDDDAPEVTPARDGARSIDVDAPAAMRKAPEPDRPADPAVPAPAAPVENAAPSVAGEGVGKAHGDTAATPPAVRTLPVPPTPAALAGEIVRTVQHGAGRLHLDLTPETLGRVRVEVAVDDDGRVRATFAVDRPDTLQLLQRDSRGLTQALAAAGMPVADGGLSFSLRQDGGTGGGGAQSAWQQPASTPRDLPATGSIAQSSPSPRPRAVGAGQLDLTV